MNEQQYGLLPNTTAGNVATPNNSTGVRLYKNSADGQYYIKKSDGTSELFVAALTGTPYLVGPYDASGNVYPADGTGTGPGGQILKGNTWLIIVGGTLNGIDVVQGDELVSLTDDPGQVGANWFVLEKNLGYVPENVTNKATDFSTVNNTKYPSVQAVANYVASQIPSVVVYKKEIVLTKAQLATLNSVPINIPNADLGLGVGQAAKIHQFDTEWHVHPDGVAFTESAPTNIVLKTLTGATAVCALLMSEVVGGAGNVSVQSNTPAAGLGSSSIIRLDPNTGFYLEATGDNIGGGGANADITVVIYYEKIDII